MDIKQIVKGAKLKITSNCVIAWAPGGEVEGIMYRKNMVLICGADKYGDSEKIEVRKIENGLYGRLYFAKKERLAESAELVK